MAGKYILSVDQSTQGTKALLFDGEGTLIGRSDVAHRQIISEEGWVSHDPEEIYSNLIAAIKNVIAHTGIDANEICAMGISNQRETVLAWDRKTGKPVCDAIVWQCGRSKDICTKVLSKGWGNTIQERTGIPVSPFFPASKLAWILENIPQAADLAAQNAICMGTVDTWLVYKLTGGKSYKTDYSNASRTQLFNIFTLQWDAEVCGAFGIQPRHLAEVCDSDANFGQTDLEGLLKKPIPICGVLGDSHGALFGQGCLNRGMIKATYGTGSSVMMNVGSKPVMSRHGVVSSIAWRRSGEIQYVLEGNINYTGAVISWMQKELGLVGSAAETQALAECANQEDTCYFVPAFTGLGAPYWRQEAKALLCGVTRLTGKAEVIKAGLECIAYQITDILACMGMDAEIPIMELRVDGGPTKNAYLMQFQSDIANLSIQVPESDELSGIGAGYMAGLSCGIFDQKIFEKINRKKFVPQMDETKREQKYQGWAKAIELTF